MKNKHVILILCAVTVMITACGTDYKTPPTTTTGRQTTDVPANVVQQPGINQTQPEERQINDGPPTIEKAEPRTALNQTQLPSQRPKTNSLQLQESKRSRAKEYDHFAAEMAAGMPAPVPPPYRIASEPLDRENYAHLDNNRVLRVTEQPVSTFSIDVDTGSYANIRRMLNEGRLPVQDAVRIEEMLHYFDYDYPLPDSTNTPFTVTTEVGPSPWSKGRHLLRIGIKGYDVDPAKLPASNLVFLIDVSGSMRPENKLGLLKKSLKLLSKRLRAEDRISIIVYAGASGVVLEPTPGNEQFKIIHALDNLQAGGSTNGASGIRLAYQLAEQALIPGGINRILLATDGDFNVGTVNFEALIDLVEEKRKTGIALTTLGFGTGNTNDHLMEQLADAANGHYAYIDTLNEAQKALVDEMASTLQTIAKDTKIQIEFNPNVVSEYRLIGYENRVLNREDFNNDKVDAGDIGAGHTVTALYEIVLATSQHQQMDALRYNDQHSQPDVNHPAVNQKELAFLRLRYKKPDESVSQLIEQPIYINDIKNEVADTSIDFRFAASVAAFGQLLKGGEHTGDIAYGDVLTLARSARGNDPFGYRSEFIQLVNLTQSLTHH